MKYILSLISCVVFFLFSGCTSSLSINISDVIDQVYQDLLDPLNEDWLIQADTENTAAILGIDVSFLEEACFYYSSSATNGTAIGGFQMKNEDKTRVLAALQEYSQKTSEKFAGFLPDQYNLAQAAEYLDYGTVVFFIMTDRNDDIKQEIEQIISEQT